MGKARTVKTPIGRTIKTAIQRSSFAELKPTFRLDHELYNSASARWPNSVQSWRVISQDSTSAPNPGKNHQIADCGHSTNCVEASLIARYRFSPKSAAYVPKAKRAPTTTIAKPTIQCVLLNRTSRASREY